MPDFLETGPSGASWTLLLAHGAGAGMETPFMTQMAGLLAERDVRVLRFEFGYMAAARAGGKRRPPPKAETLTAEYRAAVFAARETAAPARLAIGGKSMGGRVASLVAGPPTSPPSDARPSSCRASATRSAVAQRPKATHWRRQSAWLGWAMAITTSGRVAHPALRAKVTSQRLPTRPQHSWPISADLGPSMYPESQVGPGASAPGPDFTSDWLLAWPAARSQA